MKWMTQTTLEEQETDLEHSGIHDSTDMHRVIVLGKNYSTLLGAIRGLAKHGFDIYVYYVAWHHGDGSIAECSKYVNKYTEHIGRNSDEITEELISLYGNQIDKPLLLPTDDYTASVTDLHLEALSKHFLLPHTAKKQDGEIVRLMDKATQMAMAETFGLKTAKSWVVKFENGTYTLPDEIVYPCFFKPLVSFQGGKDGMRKCRSSQELVKELDAIKNSSNQFTVLVQEFLDILEEYSISGVACGEQIYLPALLRKLMVSKAHKGTTVYGIIEKIDSLGETYDILNALLKNLSLFCIIDIEVFKCGDEFYFNEINFRTSAVCYAAVAGGANVPAIFAHAMFSDLFEITDREVTFGKRFLCEKAAWDDYNAGLISKKDKRKMYREADYYIIKNDEDPRPEREFIRKAKVTRLKRQIKVLVKGIKPRK